jgi:xanthine/CO dehydrogenase XdhC/CoxF family maturation factor
MPGATAAKKTLFHATIQVTRVEEWCVEAESAEEARQLLECGEGHRCTAGELLHHEILEMLK